MTDQLAEFVKDAFTRSPSLGIALLLLLWLLRAWWFRLIEIGPKESFSNNLLRRFGMAQSQLEGISLRALGEAEVCCLGSTPDVSDGPVWKVLEIYRIYWVLKARGWIVMVTSLMFGFLAFSVMVMHIAGPTAEVSLWNVAEILGLVAIICFSLLAAVSILVVLSSAHTVPGNGDRLRRVTISLFSW